MKGIYAVILMTSLVLTITGCKREDRFIEPNIVLKKWAKSIEDLNYFEYNRYEANTKSEAVFREMYRDYYMVDLMATEVEDPDEKDVRKNGDGMKFIHRSVSFEGSLVNRATRKPYQVVRGDAVFVRFLEGKRRNDGWLISNRTLVRINR